ncbi:MAG: hypothetical protein MJZ57_00660 [Bacteroidales bacterium]|nr:hypothetical protein [Bacteroidales bacterium]
MSIIDYLSANAPIYNLPDLMQLHHSNPLGIHPIAQLIFIFIVVEVMGFFNFKIRNRGKSQYYPVVSILLAVSLIAIYYYCFQSGLPAINETDALSKSCIGWFCQHQIVGWGWAVVGVVLLVHVIYTLQCAIMQVTAEMSVHAGLSEGKKWKEWKWAMLLALMGVAACGACYYAGAVAVSWALFISQAILFAFVIGKIIADGIRAKNFLWGIAIGLVFYIGLIAVIMMTIECMRGAAFFFVVILSVLASAKASKKQPKNKKVEVEQ